MPYDDPPLPLVFDRPSALAAGLGARTITRRVDSGRWLTPWRGSYVSRTTWEAADADERVVLLALAASLGDGGDRVMSHLSAAAAWGWPMPLDRPSTAWTTRQPGPGRSTRRRGALVVELAPLDGDTLTLRHATWLTGHPVTLTRRARTVADCLRHHRAEVAVPIGDAALREGTDPLAVARTLERQGGWPYWSNAVTSYPLVDGRRESWFESASAVAFHRLGVAVPEPQVSVYDRYGTFVARVDGLWRDAGLVGESDGRAKYALGVDGLVGEERDAAVLGALWAEKGREDRLRGTGLGVTRWTVPMLGRPAGLRRQVLEAMEGSRGARFTGHLMSALLPQVVDDVLPTRLLGLRRLLHPSSYATSGQVSAS